MTPLYHTLYLQLRDNRLPFLRIADLNQYRFSPGSLKYIAQDAAYKEPRVNENDVIISRSGTLGLAVAIPKELHQAVFGSYFIRIRPDNRRVNSIYLALYLNVLTGQLQAERANTGTIQTNLTIPVIENIVVAFPPLEVQMNIADIVLQSYETQDTSKHLLELAKAAVEMAIEQDETIAEAWLRQEAGQLGVTL